MVTDRHTHTHAHKPSTVTLIVHARRGLIKRPAFTYLVPVIDSCSSLQQSMNCFNMSILSGYSQRNTAQLVNEKKRWYLVCSSIECECAGNVNVLNIHLSIT